MRVIMMNGSHCYFLINMKKIFFTLSLLYLSISVLAEKTEDMYVMRLTTQGQLFFICKNIFPSIDRKSSLPFDITYLNSTDSVSVKMTVPSHTLTHVDSVALLTEGERYLCPVAYSIYKEKEKKHWIHRCDCVFGYPAIKKCMVHPSSPQFVVYTADGEQTYVMPQNQWQKLQPHLVEIFMLIDASKR